MKKYFLTYFFLFLSNIISAQNVEYIAGNISYQHILGNCPSANFEITLTLYTKKFKIPASTLTSNGVGGFVFVDSVDIGNDVVKSRYQITQTYPSCGFFLISCKDTLNYQPAKNINSNNKFKFVITAQLSLNPFYNPNNSMQFYASPVKKISKNKKFEFNVSSTTNSNPSFDSIIHSFKSNYSGNNFNSYVPFGVELNKTSGELIWNNPDTLGTYVFLIQSDMYQNGNNIGSSIHYYKFDVTNENSSFVFDSISNIPLNSNGYKEFFYSANNTYTFNALSMDTNADSIKVETYSLDFFNTQPIINKVKSNPQKILMNFSWSPQLADERKFPYNFVLHTTSFYGVDSVTNNYLTVSYKSSMYSNLYENSISKVFTVYPNPATNTISIKSQHDIQNTTIYICNYLGQIMFTSPFTSQINLSGLSVGMYFLTIEDNNTRKTVKIIKE